MIFEEERKKLLIKLSSIKNVSEINSTFEKEFFELVNDVLINMIDGEDNFFGSFMLKIERKFRYDISWPLATIATLNGFIMYFNPYLFLNYSKKEMAALFKHEIYHMMYFHYDRQKELRDKFSNEAVSLALDISVNQYIKNLPLDAKRIDIVNMEYGLELKKNKSIEEYAFEIQRVLDKKEKKEKVISKDNDYVVKEVDIGEAHKLWDSIDISHENINNNVKKTALSLKDKDIPEDLRNIVKKYYEKEELNWQQILKRMIPSVNSGYKKTITRRNRRQPERLDLRGVLPKSIPEIVVAIDISASMNDEDIKKILIEVLAICKTKNAKITIIECDNEIRRVYPLKSSNDIRKRIKNNGSTAFSPVFKYIRDKKMRNAVLVYFTDGVGEKSLSVKPINNKVIWVICGKDNLSLNKYVGIVKHINLERKVGEGKSAALDMIREVIHEWAR